MRDGLRRWLATAGWTVVVAGLVACAAVLAVLVAPDLVGAEASYAVLSGSMAPAIQAGDAVVVRDVPASDVAVGDVVTVRRPDAAPVGLVTHRVVQRRATHAGPVFRTRGDANDVADAGAVAPSAIVGEVWFVLPAAGRIALFATGPLGVSLLVLLPGLLLVGSGWRQLRRSDPAAARSPLEVAADARDPATGVLRGRFTEDGRVRDLQGGHIGGPPGRWDGFGARGD